jgi:hypothetical protein
VAPRALDERGNPDEFSLLGGPLHRLGRRLGLVRGRTNTVALGVALGLLAWSVLVLLALIEGVAGQLFSLSVIGGHVRLLVVIPLFFLCESLLDPRARVFVQVIVRAQVVPDTEVPRLNAEIKRIGRWRDSWLPEAVCLLAAVLMSLDASHLSLPGTTAAYDPNRAGGAALWYWMVCLPLFRFLAFRWLWRLLLWWYFLWRIARLELTLVPTHPDGVGGLGYLEVVHAEFATLIAAISAAASAAFAENIVAGTTPPTALYPVLVLMLVIYAAVFLGPLCIFSPKLWLCRVTGLDKYMDLASRYVIAFDKKWLGAGDARREELLGTSDIQSLADLSTSVGIVTDMRLIPGSWRLVLMLTAAALLPLLPLLLLQYPVAQLADKLFKMMFGL